MVDQPATVPLAKSLLWLPIFAIAAALGLWLIVSELAAADGEAKKYAAEVYFDFRGRPLPVETPSLVIYGPDAPECVKIETEGLRITLPAGYPKQRPGTGVVTDFGIKGDFEITASFELIEEPKPGLGGNPTDLKLVVIPADHPEPEVWYKASQNRAGLAREAAGRGNFGGFLADATKWDPDLPKDKWGNANFSKVELHTTKRSPAKAKTGRLRLVRSGAVLSFYMNEGLNTDFTLLLEHDFGVKDLKDVRLLGSTGGPGASLDVRVADLRIRADAFPKAAPAPAPQPAAERRSLPIPLAIAAPIVIALAFASGAWLYLHKRRRSAADHAAGAEAPRAMAVSCSHCGKNLKVKMHRAGSKVKCPHCGKAVEVPN